MVHCIIPKPFIKCLTFHATCISPDLGLCLLILLFMASLLTSNLAFKTDSLDRTLALLQL